MKKVLIYFTEFPAAPGGGEFLPLTLIAELLKSCEVTLALNWRSDVPRAAAMLNIPLDTARLRIEYVKPAWKFLQKLDAVLPFYRTWQLRKLAKQADLCISAANMFDFGKPAHHFVFLLRQFGDNAFCDHLAGRPAPRGLPGLRRKCRTLLAEKILRPLLGMRSTRTILKDRKEHIYPASHYAANVMREFYGDFNSTVFYPPTWLECAASAAPPERDPLQVVALGQIFPEKRLPDIIAMVGRAREISGLNLKLSLGGSLPDTPCAAELRTMAATCGWLSLPGPRYGKDKELFLRSAAFAAHAERDEAFGIAVTEYLKCGLIPVVPDEGGTAEIVDNPALTYHTIEEGARILARLAADAEFREKQREHCRERARRFTRESYLRHQHELLTVMLGGAESGRNA